VLNIRGAIKRWIKMAECLLSPAVPTEIFDALQAAQLDSVRKQVPMLLSVAALNTVIIMAVCAHDGIPSVSYSWLSVVVLYCIIRIVIWIKRLSKPVKKADIPRLLRMNVGASLTMITGLSAAATYTFVAGTFASKLLIPMSLGFGALSIAHCLYTLRKAAIGTVVLGIIPMSVAMILVGNFDAKMLGIAMLSVAMLMVRFVAEQYDQLVASLFLQMQIGELANTDSLTGLANRRAIMAMLGDDLSHFQNSGSSFGVALLDLDGFKDINDQLGHHVGDITLQKVGERLANAAQDGDSVGRLGGDEFVIVMRGINGDNDISARTTMMMAALCQPVDIVGHHLPIAASLGYARFPVDGEDIDALLRAADTALYGAKRQNKGERRRGDFPNSVAA
jgi:diguanylate cyclase